MRHLNSTMPGELVDAEEDSGVTPVGPTVATVVPKTKIVARSAVLERQSGGLMGRGGTRALGSSVLRVHKGAARRFLVRSNGVFQVVTMCVVVELAGFMGAMHLFLFRKHHQIVCVCVVAGLQRFFAARVGAATGTNNPHSNGILIGCCHLR